MKFDNLSIRQKFAVPLAFISLLVLVVSAISISNSRFLSVNTATISNVFSEAQNLSLNADRDLYQAQGALQNLMIATSLNTGQADKYINVYSENAQQARDRMNTVRSMMSDYPSLQESISQFADDFTAWKAVTDNIITLITQGNLGEASVLFNNEGQRTFDTLRNNYDRAGESIQTLSVNLTQESLASSDQQMWYLIIAVVLTILACIGSIIFGPRLVTYRLNKLTSMIEEISEGEGDLRQRLDTSGKDELTVLATAFNALMDNLHTLISAIKNDANALTLSVSELAESAVSSEQTTAQQNTNLEQISTAVSELSHAVKEVAENSQNALQDTQNATRETASSRTAVDNSAQSISQMSSTISHASEVIQKLAVESKNITSLLNVIREIAEQTNLLALNAAIEAARAGDQGRGFAVVADEVRSLASRTQQSTEDINQMVVKLERGVSEAVEAIESGASQMDEVVQVSASVSESLQLVTVSVENANDRIYQIASATEQQSEVVSEVNTNITSLNTLSHQALDAVKLAAGVSQKINRVSHGIGENVGRFTI
ncbi:methyl-accepting chemotaxis protein [Salinimonas chungwhensis]|uniref:methyl-accepting chemotaxis protein n=1 Tax=Salinimonas chungwhensis TaxID=265425 RepID=UPI000371CDA6|nr:methyl-accepting chemotaxis protein [Salinimonas chungwhensis]